MNLQQLVGTGFQALETGDLPQAEACFTEAMRVAPQQPAVHFGIGMLRFQQNRPAEALAPLAVAADAGVALPDSWRYFCHALAVLGRDQELAGALGAGLSPPIKAELVYQIFANRAAAGDHDGIAWLYGFLPREDALRLAGAFWQAIDLADSDDVRSTELFKLAHAHAMAFRAAGHESEIVETRLGIADAMENDAFVLAAPQLESGWTIEMLCREGVADPAHGIVFAACDGSYFSAFAGDCAASLAALGPGRTFHIHIVNPGLDTEATMAHLCAENPSLALRFSIELTPGIGGAVYYASARFLHLSRILERYRVPVTMTDIDGLFRAESARLPGAAEDVDWAFFKVDTVFPWLQCHAALIHVAYSPAALEVARLLAHCLHRKLAQSQTWTLDQAALFCVLRAIRKHRPGTIVADLATVLGVPMDHVIGSQGSFEMKRQMRIAASAGL